MISDPHTTKEILISDKKIPIWIYGDLENPPIFFIHGYLRAFSDYIGDLPIRHLMKKYCLVAFDLPGSGKSRDIEISKYDFISEVQKQIVKNEKIVLFGVSYGGLVSLKYATENRDKVSKIIISGTPFFSGLLRPLSLIGMIPFNKFSKTVKEFSFLNRRNLSELELPVLLNYSSADIHANAYMGRKLKKLLPNSEMFEITGKNHKWLLHKIDESGFLSRIINFIEKS